MESNSTAFLIKIKLRHSLGRPSRSDFVQSEVAEVNKMNDSRLKGIAVILFGILLSASSAEMNRTVLASWSDFPFTLIGIIVGLVGLVMVFKSNKE